MYSMYIIFGALWTASFIFIWLILKRDIISQYKHEKNSNEKTIYPINGSVKIITKDQRN